MTETLEDRGYFIGIACECCTLATVNGDTSACEYSCGDEHTERLAEYGTDPGETVVIDVYSDNGFVVFRCVGCGDDSAGTGRDVYVTN